MLSGLKKNPEPHLFWEFLIKLAQYHTKAEILKPQVIAADFSKDQLNIILKMMKGCTMLRQGKVIDSFFECMLPDNFKTVLGHEVTGNYGTYRPTIVLNINEELQEVEADLTDEKIIEAAKTGIIQ